MRDLALRLLRLAQTEPKPSPFPVVWADIQREPWPPELKLRRGLPWMSGGGTGKSRVLSWAYDAPALVSKRFISRLKTILATHGWYILKISEGNLKLRLSGSVLLEPTGPGALVRTRPKKLFHAAPTSRRASILLKGLVPRKSRFNRNNAPRVYAITSLPSARRLVQEFIRSFPEQGTDYDIFEIDVNQLRDLSLYVDQEQPSNCVWANQPIPASALSLITEQKTSRKH